MKMSKSTMLLGVVILLALSACQGSGRSSPLERTKAALAPGSTGSGPVLPDPVGGGLTPDERTACLAALTKAAAQTGAMPVWSAARLVKRGRLIGVIGHWTTSAREVDQVEMDLHSYPPMAFHWSLPPDQIAIDRSLGQDGVLLGLSRWWRRGEPVYRILHGFYLNDEGHRQPFPGADLILRHGSTVVARAFIHQAEVLGSR